MAHTTSNLLMHVIFSTRQRRALIAPDIKPELCAYVGGIVRELRGVALIVNGTSDHVHMLVRMPTLCSVAEMVRVVKANSSRWVHEKWPNHRDFGWQIGYGAFSVSASNVNAVTKYIAEQEEHHRRKSFQEELLAFLQKNGVTYDERYLWG